MPRASVPSPRLTTSRGKIEVYKLKDRFGEGRDRRIFNWNGRLTRFEDQDVAVAALGFDERFKRMWRFYLAYCEAGFRTRRTDVGQWALARP